MKQILNVNIENSKIEYPIEISDNSFETLYDSINDITKNHKRLFIISKKVYNLYDDVFNFNENEIFILPDGEKEKNFKNYLKILQKVMELGLTRKDYLIAIGGGVVGDITGFVASTYMRGINFIQVPTTLLSAVDSSVGGKTAINFKEAKNIIGSFYQPKKVFININFLKTLDKKQFMSGLGEVLKYAFIEKSCNYEDDLYLFEFLTLSAEKILIKDPLAITRMIEYCLRLKIAVVNADEKEAGLRKILNFGHTFGHALETITKYRKFTHGEAISYGIKFIIEWAYEHEYITYSYYRTACELYKKYNFKPLKKQYPTEKLIEIMKKDKKGEDNKITFIIPEDKKTVKEVKFSIEEVRNMLESVEYNG